MILGLGQSIMPIRLVLTGLLKVCNGRVDPRLTRVPDWKTNRVT